MMRRFRDDESGTSLLLIALSLVVLLGFAAVAIDGAAAWSLKRQDQSAADTGAIAGALFTAGKTKAQAISDATDEIVRITYNTVDPQMTLAQWRTEWDSCVDPSKPVIFTDTGTSDCISFTSNLSKVRVYTPEIPWETTFAKVIGFDEVITRAFAEVDTEQADSGGVMPFALPGNAANTQEICLKTGPQPDVAPCDGPATGNFGFADFSKFGDPPAGISSVCQGGNDRLEDNIALGIDHILSTAPVYPPVASDDVFEDRDACNDGNINAQPWNFDTQTGNVAQALDDGLVDVTGNGVPGRLTRTPPYPNQESVRGHLLDDIKLSRYLVADGICGGPVGAASHDQMITCLEGYSGSSQWFHEDIAQSPRFGWVPLVHEMNLGPGGATVTIKEFRPVYIQTTFWGCNAGGCDLEWDPDPTTTAASGPANKRVEAATAIQIPLSALPKSLQDAAPGTPGQVSYLLSR
jgi:hypothetical protein